MTAHFSARRRADEFEALLSRDPSAPPAGRDAEPYADLLEVVADLRAVPPVTARPEFVASLRERLMAEADTALVRQPAAPSRLAMPARSRTRQRRIGAVLGAAALAGSAATMAVAAQTALPGESLYGVKRGIESAQVRLATDEADRGRTLLAQAGTRLTEVEELAADDAGRDQLVPDTLDSFTRQSSDGVRSLLVSYEATGDASDAQVARDFTATSMDRLERLQGELPESARDELLAAGRTLADLDLEVSSACRGCTGGITTTPDFLLTSAPSTGLLAGLDTDQLTLEGAPISGQDLTGITVPEALDPQQVVPTTLPSTTLAPNPSSLAPDPTGTGPAKPEPTKPVKELTDDAADATDGLTDTVTGTTDGVTDGLTDTTGTLSGQLDDATGGALGGLTSGADDATGGLIGEVTGTVDGLTGGTLDDATGGLLP
ncbi:DUF5667 domain-containing protein [Nocardioides pinisoli]|uniref:DUF5667 domain-containing protein n=1 Tax=Nocardioides pinisoli TaxID=2950279 RepID=A0ABT1KVG2_9ACTN|nr:DUF5667 domain-containing protein [Nocardioides pinisoli]MCP3421745.1 DUF5667 domain-containing protein [Nocardioides pinisoli]